MNIQIAIEIIKTAINKTKWTEKSSELEAYSAIGFLTGVLRGLAILHPEIKVLAEFEADMSKKP